MFGGPKVWVKHQLGHSFAGSTVFSITTLVFMNCMKNKQKMFSSLSRDFTIFLVKVIVTIGWISQVQTDVHTK